jgi:nitronate monooxygenase
MRELGRPFWLAGGYGKPEKLREALADGAAGVQMGTAFAYCAESGLAPEPKQYVLDQSRGAGARIFTDPLASPTQYPFKVVQIEGTLSDHDVYLARPRVCDLGYLREPYRDPNGAIAFRCASEPVTVYVSKGGKVENTVDRKCLCNGLMADIGLPQKRGTKYTELPLVTSGNEVETLASYLPAEGTHYTAADVLLKMLDGLPRVDQDGAAKCRVRIGRTVPSATLA